MNKTSFQYSEIQNFFPLLITLFSIFAGYLDTSIPAFILLFIFITFSFTSHRYSINQLSSSGFFVIYLLSLLFFSVDPISTLKDIKWFFGLIVFLFFLKNHSAINYVRNLLNSRNFLLLLLISIFIETILINYFFHPIQIYGSEYISSTLGSYNRPLGPMGNSSMTATFYIAYYAYISHVHKNDNLILLALFTTTILLLMSSTGFLLLTFYFIFLLFKRFINFKVRISYLYVGIIIIVSYTLIFFIVELQKISLNYYLMVIFEKLNFINNFEISKDGKSLIAEDTFQLFFGHTVKSGIPLNGGDFAWLNLFFTHGIFGAIIFVYLNISFYIKSNKKFILPLLILFLGGFHYGVIFNSAGQLLLAYLLVYNPREIVKNKKANTNEV